MHTIIRRAVTAWVLWRAHIRVRKAVPALAALDMARDEIARQHRPGARAIDVRKRRIVTERLRTELGRA
jgi:hypothetical protein